MNEIMKIIFNIFTEYFMRDRSTPLMKEYKFHNLLIINNN